MHKELVRAYSFLSILSLIVSGCNASTPTKPIPTPLLPDQQQRLEGILSKVMPSECRDLKTVSLDSQAPRKQIEYQGQNQRQYDVGCTTIFAKDNPQILCVKPEEKNDIEMTYLLAHEAGHSCGELSLVEEPIQTILNYQINDTTSVTITRNINDQEDGAPYIDLTGIRQEGNKQTIGLIELEEMITRYFALGSIETEYGINSLQYEYAKKNNIHSNSTYTIDTLYKAADITLDEVAYLKRRADANGLLNGLNQGLISIGLQYGLIDEKRIPNRDREIYYLLEFLINAHNTSNVDVNELSDKYKNFMKNSLAHFYLGQDISSLTEEKKNIINEIYLIVFGDSQIQGYLPISPSITLADGTIIKPIVSSSISFP